MTRYSLPNQAKYQEDNPGRIQSQGSLIRSNIETRKRKLVPRTWLTSSKGMLYSQKYGANYFRSETLLDEKDLVQKCSPSGWKNFLRTVWLTVNGKTILTMFFPAQRYFLLLYWMGWHVVFVLWCKGLAHLQLLTLPEQRCYSCTQPSRLLFRMKSSWYPDPLPPQSKSVRELNHLLIGRSWEVFFAQSFHSSYWYMSL